MAVFKDQNGREWIIRIHAPIIEDIQNDTKANLRTIDGLSELLADPVALVNVLWVCVRDQAAKLSVTSRAFGESLVGDSIEQAAEALVAAYRDFCPASTRKLIEESMKNAAAVEAKRQELQLAVIQKNHSELEQKIAEALSAIASPNATGLPESSASTPAA